MAAVNYAVYFTVYNQSALHVSPASYHQNSALALYVHYKYVVCKALKGGGHGKNFLSLLRKYLGWIV